MRWTGAAFPAGGGGEFRRRSVLPDCLLPLEGRRALLLVAPDARRACLGSDPRQAASRRPERHRLDGLLRRVMERHVNSCFVMVVIAEGSPAGGGGRLGDGHGVRRLLRSARVHPALRPGIGDPLSRAFACGRGRVLAPARFARLIARARRTQDAPRLSAESGSFRMARRGRLLRAVRDDAGRPGRLLRRVME